METEIQNLVEETKKEKLEEEEVKESPKNDSSSVSFPSSPSSSSSSSSSSSFSFASSSSSNTSNQSLKPSVDKTIEADQLSEPVKSNKKPNFNLIIASSIGVILSSALLFPFSFLIGIVFGVIISFVLIFIFLTQTTSETPISVDLEELSTKILPTNKLSSTPTSNISIDKPPVQVEGQPPIESCHWFNKILKVIIREQFNSPSFRSFYQAKIEKKIHKIQKPDFIGEIKLVDVDWGNNLFEIVHGVQMLPPKYEGETRLECKMRYSGNSPAKATIQVQVWIHFPKKFFASVFVNLTITFTYLSGTILAVCPPGPNPQITLGFSSAPTTKLLIATGVGKHNQTKNISILNNFFMEKIRSTIRHELMVPNGIMLRIPIKKERPFKFYLIRKYKEGKYKDSAPPVNRAAKPPVPPPVNRASKPTNPSPSSPSSPSLTEETEINYSESETGSTQSENVSELIRAEDLYEAFASDENINKNLDPTPPQSSVIPPLRSHTSLSTSLNAPKVLPEDEEVSPVTETSLAMKPNIPGEEKTLCVVEEDEEDKLIERRIRNLSNPDTSLHEHQTLPPSNQPNQPPPVNRNTKPPPVNRNTKPNNP